MNSQNYVEESSVGEMLAKQLERLLAELIDAKKLSEIEKSGDIGNLWQRVEQLGLTMALAPESVGGAGLTFSDCYPLFRCLGRYGAPLPLAETMLASLVLTNADLPIPEGPIVLTSAEYKSDRAGMVTGVDKLIPWLPVVRYAVGVSSDSGQSKTFLYEIDSEHVSVLNTIARVPAARLTLKSAPVALSDKSSDVSSEVILKSYDAMLRASYISGALERILHLVVDYANTRQQFGKTIGKFQAIQHHVAEIAMQCAASQAAGMYACRCFDSGNPMHGAAIAKIQSGAAAGKAAISAHQVFGAIGITDEHELHYFTRRLWQWRDEAGSEFEWAEYLGRDIFSKGGSSLWSMLVGQDYFKKQLH